ncbi:MFS transporter [Sanguibacter suaedae]|uniref:MFS transporter n=1 Tax=Sanguibacter suaedae TaxID=2795737 RepID=A0A934I3C3_9MICO|nr:MFS transporter [Sanguibacter suaedae]MBI9113476.1 MFS transporter [Sanguibacter suaedae]
MTPTDTSPGPLGRALLVWGTAIVAYVVAVVHRTSLGVAGLDAVDRFDVTAAVLSTFTVVQIAVYASAQIPVGVLLDRLGPRRLVAGGAALMAAGQLGMALADTVPLALAARVLIGAGDATTFVSLLRLVPSWFAPRRVPVVTQLTGLLGQLGQIVSAVPFVVLLHGTTWTTAFVVLACAGGVVSVLVWAVVRDSPGATPAVPSPSPGPPGKGQLRAAARTHGTWLGFFSHMIAAYGLNAFVLLWGYPFLVLGQGVTPGTAGALLSLSVVVGIVAGPVLGELTARHPLRRSWLVLGISVIGALGWIMVLVPSTPRPLWVLVLFVAALAIGGPGSMIGFDFVRTSNPPERLGAATGLANMGAFVGALVTIFAIGLVLDAVRPSGEYTLDDFRVAMSVVAVPWVVACVGLLVSRRGVRRDLAEQGIVVPPVAEAWRAWRSRER